MITIEFILPLLGNLVGLFFCLGYALYLFLRKGIHVRGQGWKTKDEAPKSYYFTLGMLILISVGSLVGIIARIYNYYFN